FRPHRCGSRLYGHGRAPSIALWCNGGRMTADRPLAADPFRLALEAAPTGFIVVDERGRIVLVNAEVERLFGYRRAERVEGPIEGLVPERPRARHGPLRNAFFAAPTSRPMGAGLDLTGLRKDGSEVPLEIALSPLETSEGRFVLGSVVDISDRKRGERERDPLLGDVPPLNAGLRQRVEARTAELRAALEEREVLLQAVHHRVKNNLQVISSLINMQLRTLGKDASRAALEECRTRVHAITLIHEKLYQSRNYAQVPFSEYARGLALDIFNAADVSRENVSLELAVEDVALAVDKAIPCGLILNELITNALKHAFPDGRTGTIRVELARAERGGLRLPVADDGVGLPPGLDGRRSPALGLPPARILASQVDAALDVDAAQGACFRLTVPEER